MATVTTRNDERIQFHVSAEPAILRGLGDLSGETTSLGNTTNLASWSASVPVRVDSLTATEDSELALDAAHDYLQSAAERGTISESIRKAAYDAWVRLDDLVPEDVAAPIMSAHEDAVLFYWDDNDTYLEAEITSPSSVEWFYRQKDGDRLRSDECPIENPVPEWVVGHLMAHWGAPVGMP